MQAMIASNRWAKVNWGRVIMALVVVAFAAMLLTEPAYAFGAFEKKVTAQTEAATGVAQGILRVAAVLALLVGLAPMLWGQFKAKWVISCCIGAVLIFLVGEVITAFAGAR